MTTRAITHQPLKWHGGKYYLAGWIQSLAPRSWLTDDDNGYTHRNICFAGGLGEFWNWLPITGISETINDKDLDVTNFYTVIGSDGGMFEQFQHIVELNPFSEVTWQKAHEMTWAKTGMDFIVWRAAMFFFNYRMSRQGLAQSFATPTTRTRRGMNELTAAYLSAVDGLQDCHERLRRVVITNMDFIPFLKKHDHERALFYLDPPYHPDTRLSIRTYHYEMDDERHKLLLSAVANIKGKFMLSGYKHPWYEQQARAFGWNCHERDIPNAASSCKQKETKTECLWTNY